MEWLKELIGEELFKQITEKLGDKTLLLNDGNWIPKKKFDEKIEEIKSLNEKIAIYVQNEKDTKKLLDDNEDYKKKYEDLQKTSKSALEGKDKEISDIVTKGLLKDELIEMGSVYPDLLIKNINLDDVLVKDGKILNKETVLNPLKDTYKDLFKTTIIEGNDPNPSGNKNPNPDGFKNPFSKEHWNMTEQALLYKNDKAMYDKLKNTK